MVARIPGDITMLRRTSIISHHNGLLSRDIYYLKIVTIIQLSLPSETIRQPKQNIDVDVEKIF